MTTFEERYTAWLEDSLPESERIAFERELPNREEAEQEKRDFAKMKRLLASHGSAPRLTNPDFFNYQLTERIAAEERKASPPKTQRRFAWPIPHLAWAGICSLLVFALVFKTAIPDSHQPQTQSPALVMAPSKPAASQEIKVLPARFDSQVTEVHSADPDVTATAVPADKDGGAIIWTDGMDYLPANYKLQ